MCLRQIPDMDVIPDTAAVRGVVVVAEKFQTVTLPCRRLKDNGDQVAFRAVILTVKFRGSRRIKVTQSGIIDAVDLVIPLEHLFKAEFGFAVRIDGNLTVIFGNGHLFWLSEGGGGTGKNKILHLTRHSGIRQIDGRSKVVAEIFGGILHGFPHQ